MEEELKKKQEIVNELYAREGLTDEVLDLQVEINKLRHEHDIVDKSEIINEEGYVQ